MTDPITYQLEHEKQMRKVLQARVEALKAEISVLRGHKGQRCLPRWVARLKHLAACFSGIVARAWGELKEAVWPAYHSE